MYKILIAIIILIFCCIIFTLMAYLTSVNIYNTLHDIIKGNQNL